VLSSASARLGEETAFVREKIVITEGTHLKIPLSKPVLDEEMKDAATDALQNEKFVMGESVFKFEEEFAKYCGVKYAVSTSSGTFALQFSLEALGINQKAQVITTPYSFIATSNAALLAGAVPVFADIDPKTYNIDPALAKRELTSKTKAIVPVHLYGFPADMKTILEGIGSHGCAVVEDACQAHGAEFQEKKVGTLGNVGCFSFYPSKNMTVCGDGGMVTTNDEDVASKIAKLRDCGRKSHYEHDVIGITARLNTVNAAIGRVQLKRLDGWNEKRRTCARLYDHLLSGIDGPVLPPNGNSRIKPVYHLYVIRTTSRDELKAWLESCGIQCGIHYPLPIHLQPIYRSLFGYKEGDFPESELASKSVLSLPMFPELEKEEVEYVCGKVHEFFDQNTSNNLKCR
jgi:perosamine synthetase